MRKLFENLRHARPAIKLLGMGCVLLAVVWGGGQHQEEMTIKIHVVWKTEYKMNYSQESNTGQMSDSIQIIYDGFLHAEAPAGSQPWDMNTGPMDEHLTVSGGGSGRVSGKDSMYSQSWVWTLKDAPKMLGGGISMAPDGTFSVNLPSLSGVKTEPQIQRGDTGEGLQGALSGTFGGMMLTPRTATGMPYPDPEPGFPDSDPIFWSQLKGGKFDPGTRSFLKSGSGTASRQDHSTGTIQGLVSATTYSVQATYSFSFNQEPEEVDAIMIPQPDANPPYEQWMPAGGADEDTPGNTITVNVVLQKKGQPGSAPTEKAQFKFELGNVSHEPGVSGNWPPNPKSKDGQYPPDLKIDPAINPTLKVASDGQSADSPKGLQQSQITITSYDWAAYGKLKVTATLDDGNQTVAYVQAGPNVKGGPGVTALTIPQDDNGNFIADALDRQLGFGGGSEAPSGPPSPPIAAITLPFFTTLTSWAAWLAPQAQPSQPGVAPDPDSDDDSSPTGDGTPGDGLSYFEEARGFNIQGQHKYTDPRKKDLFVFNPAGLDLSLFVRSSGITVWQVAKNEFCEDCDQESPNHNVINHVGQTGGHHRLGNVHVVVIETVEPTETEAAGNTAGESNEGSPPGGCGEGIRMVAGALSGVPNAQSQLLQNVAHELAHCANVRHHGDTDYYATRVTYVSNNKPVSNADLGLPNDAPFIRVAAPKGEESGRQECIMRYNRASALYEHPGGSIKWNKFLPSGRVSFDFTFGEMYKPWELPGTIFCDSQKGTGAAGRKAGNATRGNCKGEFCVNDIRGCKSF
jgi:hypothetical protein